VPVAELLDPVAEAMTDLVAHRTSARAL
jgi:lipoyl(octanoyl) transferase